MIFVWIVSFQFSIFLFLCSGKASIQPAAVCCDFICRYFENTTRSIDYVATSYKRINNLLLGNKINLMKIVPIVLQPKKFSNKEEENLYRSYFALKKDIKLLTSKNDYTSIMDGLFDLSRSVNEFLSKNYVNKVGVFKKNRYVKLLFACKNLYNKVIRFDDGVWFL